MHTDSPFSLKRSALSDGAALRISPSSLSGSISIPPSKSHTLRALLFASLAKGISEIRDFLHSPDTTAMVRAMRLFGAHIDVSDDVLLVKGFNRQVKAVEDVIDAGNSGLLLRFAGALAALSPHYTVVTGDASIRHRRIAQPLLKALRELGAFAVSAREDGFAPLIFKGPILGGYCSLEGADSQPISALLSIAPFLEAETTIAVENPGETPWIDLTLSWLKRLNLSVSHHSYTRYVIPGGQTIEGFSWQVPGDLSSLAFPVGAALITNSELLIHNVDMQDVQGDKKCIELLMQMGAKIEVDAENKRLFVRKNSPLHGISIDLNTCIDALPILSVVACFAEGKTHLYNGKIARCKESDRIHAMATELKKMGAHVEENEDGLLLKKSQLKGASLYAHADHRVAMALSVAALGASSPSEVRGSCCIAKTYPDFASSLQQLGANIE